MITRNRYPLAALAAVAVLALAVTVAFASGTTVRTGSSTGSSYSGGTEATNLGNIVTTHSLGTTTCSSVSQDGTTDSDGDPVSVTGATYGTCSNSDGTTTTVTAQNLPWSGTLVATSNTSHDGELTLNGVKMKSVRSDGLTCYYTSSGGVSEVYNGDNPNRPDTSSSEAQVHMVNESMSRASGSGFLCPRTTSTSGVLELKTSSGGSLYITH